MRKEMNRYKGSRWSAESGSVYRVLRRLTADGLVKEARKAGVPNRERTEYELTTQGDAMIYSWLTFPPDRDELAYLIDPLRTRSYWLSRLKPAEKVRVVKTWLHESKALVEELERHTATIRTSANEERALAYSNLTFMAEARVEWLRKLLAFVRTTSKEA